MLEAKFALLPIDDLKTHETVEEDRVRRVMRQIKSTGLVKKAIVVDSGSMVVLDGVHRLTALRMLGCVRVPAWLVDYSKEDIIVLGKAKSQVPKELVVEAATKGPKLPPKSTRHMVKGKDGVMFHISRLGGDISVPLATLRRPAEADKP